MIEPAPLSNGHCHSWRNRLKAVVLVVLGLAGSVAIAGCGSSGPGRPAVLGAVFGLANADVAPFEVGTIADPVVRPEDSAIGQAANNPGQCIYVRGTNNRRFRANCPDGYVIP